MSVKNFDDCRIELFVSHRSEDFFRLIDSNRSQLEDFFSGTVARTKTLKDTLGYGVFIEKCISEKTYFPYMICNRTTGDYIGLIDIKSIDWTVPKAELGYLIDQQHSGKGIATKALEHVIAMCVAVHRFRKLLCRIHSENEASVRVVKKNGFQLEGTIRKDYITSSGRLVDLDYYGKVF